MPPTPQVYAEETQEYAPPKKPDPAAAAARAAPKEKATDQTPSDAQSARSPVRSTVETVRSRPTDRGREATKSPYPSRLPEPRPLRIRTDSLAGVPYTAWYMRYCRKLSQ